ncbi:DNA polymerase III subunit psi [Psychromonas sp. CD1]|uniref:DNA polymerase III subunit psi n=1 Tax=Psychromonas sp. CD1 TaxID=1979839 RepID=UPI000B9C082F|nr:DNA polymerase III subunit psi [Psychromonas sp. CD1]
MQHKKTLYLQEMGITRWILRNEPRFVYLTPQLSATLNDCELLIICAKQDRESLLLTNILKAFNIKTEQVYYCTMSEFLQLKANFPAIIWSTQGAISGCFDGSIILNSPSIAQLYMDAKKKKKLWEEYCDAIT